MIQLLQVFKECFLQYLEKSLIKCLEIYNFKKILISFLFFGHKMLFFNSLKVSLLIFLVIATNLKN